ncbi:MAG: hypothetical protein Tsb0021_15470 [Chlamydiales bacterium]
MINSSSFYQGGIRFSISGFGGLCSGLMLYREYRLRNLDMPRFTTFNIALLSGIVGGLIYVIQKLAKNIFREKYDRFEAECPFLFQAAKFGTAVIITSAIVSMPWIVTTLPKIDFVLAIILGQLAEILSSARDPYTIHPAA